MITILLRNLLGRNFVIGLAGALAIASSGFAQDTNAPTVMKPTVVTGSYIPTAETVGPAPVNIVTSVDIQRSGQQDVLSVLTRLDPSFSGSFNLGQQANNFTVFTTPSESAGEANVAIRNLPTLVLLDGRRLANSALSAGQAVDLNTIPISIIDRVDVLKDGASALYGSDAVGGVVNVITKKNWNGVEIGGRVGFPTRPDSNDIIERRASLILGAAADNYSFFGGGQYYAIDPLLAKDRHVASASIQDLLARGIVPPSYISPSYPGRVQDTTGSYILAGSPFAAGGPGYNPRLNTPPIFPGHPPFPAATAVQDYNTYAIGHGYVDPTGHGLGPYVPLSLTPEGSQLTALGVGNFPLINTTDFGVISIQRQDRRNFFANLEHDLFDKNLQVFGSFLYANNISEAQLAPSPVPSLGGSGIFVPGTNPFNPFGLDLGASPNAAGLGTPRVRYRFIETQNRIFDADSSTYHLVGGLKGQITPRYDWEAAYTYNRSDQTDFTRNAINGAALNAALAGTLTDPSGNPLPPFNIFSLPGYNTTNAPATLRNLKTTLFLSGLSESWGVDGHVHGQPFDLPAGPVDFVVGGEYYFENLNLAVDGLTQLGLVPGLNAAFTFSGGKRDRYAGFGEVKIPIFSEKWNVPGAYSLELDVQGRYERIFPGGDSGVPKIVARWQPIDNQLTVRGGYSQGFIAPAIFNLFGPDVVSDPTIVLPGGSGQVQTQTRANPHLPPSESQNWSAGIVYSPKQIPGLTVSADYYNIAVNHVVIADPVVAAHSLNALGSASPFAPGFTFADQTRLTTTAPNQLTVDNWGNLIITNTATEAIRTHGLDLSANYDLPTDRYGRFTFMANAEYVLSFEVQSDPALAYHHYQGLYTANFGAAQGLIPDYRINVGLGWNFLGFDYTVLAHYIPGVADLGFLHPQIGDTTHGNTVDGLAWHVAPYYTIDMQLAYIFDTKFGRFLNGTRVAVGVNNITDTDAPLIASGIEDNTDKATYDIMGRFVYFEVSKKF